MLNKGKITQGFSRSLLRVNPRAENGVILAAEQIQSGIMLR